MATNSKEKQKVYSKTFYDKHREEECLRAAEFRKNNKEIANFRVRRWQKDNKKRISEKITNRCKTDINFKLVVTLRIRLYHALKKNQKVGSAVKDLGCSIPELKEHLEKQFKPGMTWENWSHEGWHIDHIKALANFDLTDRQQFLEANHYTNLQPLWAKDNIRKSNKDGASC